MEMPLSYLLAKGSSSPSDTNGCSILSAEDLDGKASRLLVEIAHTPESTGIGTYGQNDQVSVSHLSSCTAFAGIRYRSFGYLNDQTWIGIQY